MRSTLTLMHRLSLCSRGRRALFLRPVCCRGAWRVLTLSLPQGQAMDWTADADELIECARYDEDEDLELLLTVRLWAAGPLQLLTH